MVKCCHSSCGCEGGHWQSGACSVRCWALFPGACSCVSSLFSNLHCTGSVGSPGVTSIKFVPSYVDRCGCLSFETLHLKLCSTLVTVLPLEVWNTEKFSWEEISTSVFFLLPEQRKMWNFVIKREHSPFFHIANLTNRVWLFSRHYLLASYSLQIEKKIDTLKKNRKIQWVQ